MRLHNFDTQIWLPKERDEVFAFFADPRNLETLTPAWLHFEILTPAPIEMKAGTRLDYRLRLRGIPLRWQSEITEWQPPDRFADRQTRGPYRFWLHTHSFHAQGGGTIVADCVRYGVFCDIVAGRLFVARDLRRIFSYRHEMLRKLFGAEGAARP